MSWFLRSGANRILLFAIVALLVYFGFASVGKAWEAYGLQQDERRLNKEIEELKAYNTILEKQKEYAQSDTAIEYEARQMGLIKPGETAVVVVIPPEAEAKPEQVPKPEKQQNDTRPNWQRWWDMFFGDREGG